MKYSAQAQKQLFELSKILIQKKLSAADLDDLIKVLHFHEYKYYIENNSIISDQEYDVLFHGLRALEEANPLLIRTDSPTQRVASDLTESFESVDHLTPMLSLGNAYNLEDLKEFNKQLVKLCQQDDLDYFIEPKFDGGSIALVYENDLLVRGATRGNGVQGDDITVNARTMNSVPLSAAFSKYNIHKVELRGEVVIRKDVFDQKNLDRQKEGKALFANARNAATGGLRMKSPQEVAKRGLEAFIFQVALAEDKDGNNILEEQSTHSATMQMLSDLGFKIDVNASKRFNNIEDTWSFAEALEKKRESYPYEIDGMVIKLDHLALQRKCGMTGHHPRWAVALKFQAKQATTTLLDVEYQVGKVGSITPVAKVEPVHLAGVTISSISLHNADFIEQKDLRIGDTVVIERAGDVIPYIVKSLEELRDGSEDPIVFPRFCPIPKGGGDVALVRAEGEAAWRCPSCNCGRQDVQKIIFHVSKDAMDIDGFGKSYVERFNQEGWLNDFSDVYNLDYTKISQLEGFGERSAKKLEQAIDQAKKKPLSRILYSLSIHHLGKKVSKLLAMELKDARDLKDWTLENFTEIKDVGPVVANNVIAWFGNPDNIALLGRMEANGLDLSQKEADKPLEISDDAPLAGKTILFTGSLSQMGRKEAQELATKAGAKNISAVSKNLNILVAGEKAGSKLKKAQALGTVEIISEQDFLDIIG